MQGGANGRSGGKGVMGFGRFRTDPTFDEFVWLAPMHSVGAVVVLVALASGSYALATGESATTALSGAGAGIILVPMLGLAIVTMNMVLAYLPSAVAWHLTLRLTLARPGRREAIRAAAATAVTANLILALWGSIFLLPQDRSNALGMPVHLRSVAILMAVSVVVSIWTADRIEKQKHA